MKLKIENVGKKYKGDSWAVNNFNLMIDCGVLGLLGPNGAGKSTLMRILSTITKPTCGRILWNDIDIVKKPDEIRRVLGYLPQNFGVYPHLNAVEFLEYIAAIKGIKGKDMRKKIKELIQLLNLHDVVNKPLGSYSGGMKQRVGIAQALLNDPKILIVDEPTVGLDPQERINIRNLFSEISSERIIIYSTHIVSDIEAVSSKIAIINNGKLVICEEPEKILKIVEGKVWQCDIPASQFEEVRKNYLINNISRRNNNLYFRVISDTPPTSNAMLISPMLEDVYLYYTSISLKESIR